MKKELKKKTSLFSNTLKDYLDAMEFLQNGILMTEPNESKACKLNFP